MAPSTTALLLACLLAASCHPLTAAPGELTTVSAVTVSSWPELLAAVAQPGVQHITLQQPHGGKYIVNQTADITNKEGLTLTGLPSGHARVLIDCAGMLTAFSISTSTSIELSSMHITGCAASAVRVEGASSKWRGQNTSVSLTVRACNFTDHHNAYDAGGAISANGAKVVIADSTFVNCTAGEGGAIAGIDAALVVNSCHFAGVHATGSEGGYGGAISVTSGTLDVASTTFLDCFAAVCGGAVNAHDAAYVTVRDCSIHHCSAASYGGAVNFEAAIAREGPANLTLAGNTFISNHAGDTGGALTVLVASVEAFVAASLYHNTFQECQAPNAGAVVVSFHVMLRMRNSTFKHNKASLQAGALLSVSDDVQIINSTFANNEALQGAAIQMQPMDATVVTHTFQDCTFLNNSAGREGGALHGYNVSIAVASSTFQGNSASVGGGVYLMSSNGTDAYGNAGAAPVGNFVNITNCRFVSNVAREYGAGIAADGVGVLLVQGGSTFEYNTAMGSGAAITMLQVTSATIQASHFMNNRATYGAAVKMKMDGQRVNFTGCTLAHNLADHGAAFLVINATLVLASTNLTNNTAIAGGAIAAYAGTSVVCGNGTTLWGNNAFIGGGMAAYSSGLVLFDCVLSRNTAKASADTPLVKFISLSPTGLGGAIYVVDSHVQMAQARLAGNHADGFGGGAFMQASSLDASGGHLVGNKAVVAGGALYIVNAAQNLSLANMHVVANTAAHGGGIAASTSSASPGTFWVLQATNVSFQSNEAVFVGGAIAATNVPMLDVRACRFMGNNAGGNSGAFSCARCGQVVLAASTFLVNSASSCGAASIVQASLATTIDNCSFLGNVAGVDATKAALAVEAQTLTLGMLAANAAVAKILALLPVEQVTALGGTAAIAQLLRSQAIAPGIQAVVQPSAAFKSFGQLPDWQSVGSGGALCLQPIADVGVSRTLLTNNSAMNGGGIFLDLATPHSSLLTIAKDSAAYNNMALNGTGASLYTTRASGYVVAPSASLINQPRISSHHTALLGNHTNALVAIPAAAVAGGSSQPVATSPTRLIIVSPSQLAAAPSLGGGESLQPPLLDADGNLANVSVALVDEFGQLVPSAVAEQLVVEASAEDIDGGQARLLGLTSMIPWRGSARFPKLLLQGPPGHTFAITFSVPLLAQLTPVTALVIKSNCSAGQSLWLGEAGVPMGCTTCSTPLFSFMPDSDRCELCPEHAAPCNGSLLMPQNGSYHSHPRSAQVWTCPSPRACIRSQAAQEHMAAVQHSLAVGGFTSSVALPADVLATYQQAMCAEGYTGHLCGVCVEGGANAQRYGKVWGRCVLCHRTAATSIAMYCLARLFDLAVIGLQIFIITKDWQRRQGLLARVGRFAAANAALHLMIASHKKRSGGQLTDPNMGSAFSWSSPAQHQSEVEAIYAADVEQQRDQDTPLAEARWGDAAFEEQPPNAAQGLDAAGDCIEEHEKWQGCFEGETVLLHLVPVALVEQEPAQQSTPGQMLASLGVFLEFVIEFCQLLSILRLAWVEAEWAPGVQSVYNAIAFTPLASAAWVPFDCMLPYGTRNETKAYARIISAILMPVCYSAVICAAFVAAKMLRRLRLGRRPVLSLRPLQPLLIISVVKVVSYCYPAVTHATLAMFSCRRVDAAPSVPGEVVAAQGSFWTQDYAVHCFEGPHLTLLLAAGVPALLVLVLGYPLSHWLLLARRSRAGSLSAETQFWANYGMLYEDFRPRLYFWGSVKELRKLALVAVVVGLRTQSAGAQLVGAWSVTLFAICSHLLLVPYRSALLNMLQLAMLGAMLCTVFLNLFLALTTVSARASLALQVIFLAVDCGVGLLLLCLLLCRAWLQVKQWLDADRDGRVSWADVRATGSTVGAVIGRTLSLGDLRGSYWAGTQKPGAAVGRMQHGAAAAEAGGNEEPWGRDGGAWGARGCFAKRQRQQQRQVAEQRALAAVFSRQQPPAAVAEFATDEEQQ